MPPRSSPPRILPAHVPALSDEQVLGFLAQKSPLSLAGAFVKGQPLTWHLPIENHGGRVTSLTVEVRGPALAKRALEVTGIQAISGRKIHEGKLRRLKDGVRAVFEARLVQPPRLGREKARDLEGLVTQQVLAAFTTNLPALHFRATALATPPRRAVPFTVSVLPGGVPAGGFSMSYWFGHIELRFDEFG